VTLYTPSKWDTGGRWCWMWSTQGILCYKYILTWKFHRRAERPKLLGLFCIVLNCSKYSFLNYNLQIRPVHWLKMKECSSISFKKVQYFVEVIPTLKSAPNLLVDREIQRRVEPLCSIIGLLEASIVSDRYQHEMNVSFAFTSSWNIYCPEPGFRVLSFRKTDEDPLYTA